MDDCHGFVVGSNEAFFDEARERRPSGITAQRNLHKVLSAFVLDFDPKLLPGKDGASPLHYAVRSENFALLQVILVVIHRKDWLSAPGPVRRHSYRMCRQN